MNCENISVLTHKNIPYACPSGEISAFKPEMNQQRITLLREIERYEELEQIYTHFGDLATSNMYKQCKEALENVLTRI